jgi:hypothetical protein
LILNPAVIALISSSVLVSLISVYAAVIGVQIIRWWDLKNGTERQLALERQTYLVSTVLAYLLVFELLSLGLFVFTADRIHTLFIGAMCAAGSLAVNDYGYPTLILKMLNFILCGIWLIVNHTDNLAEDYPLIRIKYRFLLVITPLLLLEAFVQVRYFLNLKPDVITSCCGIIFDPEGNSPGGDLAHLSSYAMKIVFYLSVVLMLRVGIHFYLTGRAAGLFANLSAWLLGVSLVSIISFISVYFYELPTHHCPFCLLQKEYHYIGYPLYLSLFGAGITGAGLGVIERFKNIASLRRIVPRLQKRLVLLSMSGYLIFTAIASYPILFSGFKLEGY